MTPPDRLNQSYGSAPMLNWLVEEKGIAPQIPVIDKSAREDGSFSRSDFRYDDDEDVYICPTGKQLRTSGTIVNDDLMLYRGATADCRNCLLKPHCCPNEPVRKLSRSIYEAARDVPDRFSAPRPMRARGATARRLKCSSRT